MQSLPDNSPENTDLAGNELELSDAERAALDSGKEGAPAANADGTAAPTNNDGAPAAGADAGAAAPAAGASGAAPAGGEGGAPAAGDPAPAADTTPTAAPPAQPFVPTMKVEDRDFDKELADNKAALLDLRAKHAAGELDDDAYELQYEQLQDQKVSIKVEQSSAALAQQFNQQGLDQSWEYLQKQFLLLPENAAINGNKLVFAAWEAAMQDVVNDAAQQNRQITDWDLFAGARQKLVEAGLMTAAPARQEPAAAAAAAVPAQPDRRPPLNEVPTTLSAVPAGADALGRSTVDQMVESGDIEDIETRMSGMSEVDRERLLAGVPGHFLNN
ncbi:MAG TPA: hypothetical protein VGE09_06205 [Pseudoxanthomonas sp.]